MTPSQLDRQQYALLFDIRRSVRYHDRRRAFFERMHRVTGALTIVLAGGVLFELAGTGSPALWLQCFAVAAAVLSAFDIVVGYAARANDHAALRVRFVSLEMKMLAGDLEEATWCGYRQERLAIERDEPPIYRALDLLCHNEMLRAEGFDPVVDPAHFSRLSAWQRLTSQFLHWPNIMAA